MSPVKQREVTTMPGSFRARGTALPVEHVAPEPFDLAPCLGLDRRPHGEHAEPDPVALAHRQVAERPRHDDECQQVDGQHVADHTAWRGPQRPARRRP